MLDQLQALFSGESETSEPSVQVRNATPIDTETIKAVARDTPELNTEDLATILNSVQEYCERGFADNSSDLADAPPEEHPVTELLQTQYDRNAIEHTVTTKQSTFASIIKGERWQTIGDRLGLSPTELKAVQEAHNKYLADMDTGMVGITVNGIVVAKPSSDESGSSPQDVASDQTADVPPADTLSGTQGHSSVVDPDTNSETGSNTESDIDVDSNIEHADPSDESESMDSETEGDSTAPSVAQQGSGANNNTDTSTTPAQSASDFQPSDSDSQQANGQSPPAQSDPEADSTSAAGGEGGSDTDPQPDDDEPLSSTGPDIGEGEFESSDDDPERTHAGDSGNSVEEDDTRSTSEYDESPPESELTESDSASSSTSPEHPNAEASPNGPPSDSDESDSDPPTESSQPADAPSHPNETQDFTSPPSEPTSQSPSSTTDSDESSDSEILDDEDDPLAEIEELLSDTQDED